MIGVGPFELGIGLLVVIPLVYFVFRRSVSTVGLAFLIVVLSPILAMSVGLGEAVVSKMLFGG